MRSTLGFYLPSLITFKEFLVQAAPTVAAKALDHG